MFSVGSVIYVYNDKIVPQKNKYMVCVAVDDDLFLCINSENRRIYECVPITKKGNPYLSYDSYIACNSVFRFEKGALKQAREVGRLGYGDLVTLRDHIRDAVRTLASAEKQRIVDALNRELEDMC